MSDAAEPRWDMLPHKPQEFFELVDGYDLGDLKRSYNRLIRRFKPEKFPAEFQRIRAAYEMLNGALRYNVSLRPSPTRAHPPEPREESKPAETNKPIEPPRDELVESPAAETSIAKPEAEKVLRAAIAPQPAEDAPHETYARLKYQEFKSAEDYITLALLADVVNPHAVEGQAESFLDWLFAGLGDHPRDWAITALVRQYLADEHDPRKIIALLLRTVEAIPHDRFQYVTEQAWDRLCREATFDEFRECLDRCGVRLGRAVDRAQLVFYVHILKFAVWKADTEFLDGIFATVEDHYHQLDRYALGEYEMLAELRGYIAEREAFIARGPCCARIDQALRDWCLLPESAGDLSVLDCQYFINLRGQRLCDEFLDAKDDLSALLVPWDRIVSDVLERLDEPRPPDMEELSSHARDFLIRHSRRLNRTLRNNLGMLLGVGGMGMFLVVLVATISFVIRAGMNFYAWQWGWGLLDCFCAFLVLIVGAVASAVTVVRNFGETKLRYRDVRRDSIALFRIAAITPRELAAELEKHEDQKYGDSNKIDGADAVASGLRRDVAMQIFSLAQICLRAADVAPEDAPLIIL